MLVAIRTSVEPSAQRSALERVYARVAARMSSVNDPHVVASPDLRLGAVWVSFE